MTERERQRSIQLKLSRMHLHSDGAIPTGFPPLDAALGGGLPRGRMVELFGPPSVGKTTLALQAAAAAQSLGLNAAWIDADRSFDPSYAAFLGVRTECFTVAQPDSAEQAMEIARRLADSTAVDLIIFDSAAALVPSLELAAGLGDSGPSLQARVLASGLRRLRTALLRSATAALFLNQTRSGGQGEEETTAGGPPLRLFAAARIALRPGIASRVEYRMLKNKISSAFSRGELTRIDAGGFARTP